MKITLQRHGGLAAIRRPPQVLETSQLPPEVAEGLESRIAALGPEAAEQPGPGRVRDAMSYTITVDEGGATKVWRQSDGNMSDAFAALLELLEGQAGGSH